MTDEKPIYISPEDDVTTVRERLEKTSNRQVTLVIPEQTQLRSLVAWRVLHADARRMSKDVLVVSTDPQIRSLAQACKFRVAHSQQASSITNKSRPPTRPGRAGGAAKSKSTSSQARMQAAKKPSVQLPPEPSDERNENTPGSGKASRKADALNQWYSPLPEASPTSHDIERSFDRKTTGNLREKSTFSSSLSEPMQEPGRIYDIHTDATPRIHQVPPPLQEEEPATYWADTFDYKQAEDIRNSAQHNDANAPPLVVPLSPQTPRTMPHSDQQVHDAVDAVYDGVYKTTPLPQPFEESAEPISDFYQMMNEHIPQSSLNEQHGSAIINGIDSSEPVIHDGIVEVQVDQANQVDVADGSLQVEYLGEDPSILPITEDMQHHSRRELPGQEQQENIGALRNYKANALRGGQLENRDNMPLSPRRQDLDDPADLPPVEERQTVIMSPQEFSPVLPPRGGTRPIVKHPASTDIPEMPVVDKKITVKRASQQILGSNPRLATPSRAKNNISPRATTNVETRRPNTTAGRGAATRKLPAQSSKKSGAILALIAVLLLLLIGIPAFVLPTADVTLKLPSKDYLHAVTLKAVPSGQQGSATDIVPADQLTNNFETTGAGKATGSAQVGIASATGTVTFTNNGQVLVTIPSGTTVTTSNGTTFSTQAEAVVNIANSNIGSSIQVPIKAQTSGTSGNVPPGSINFIPPDSLNSIVAYNKMNVSDLKLTVTNEQATTSGGVGYTPAIAQKDINVTKAGLSATLNNQFKTWLAQKVASGDQAGIMTTTETLENAPSVGQITADGAFTEKLKLNVTVLIVRASTIQRAAIIQLNQFMRKEKGFSSYAMVDDAKHPVQVQQLKTTSYSKSALTLTFIAAGKVVPNLDRQHIQSLIDGKSIKDARSTLQNIQGVQHVDISTAPQIGSWAPSWLPFWSAHITVHLVPEDTVAVPKKK